MELSIRKKEASTPKKKLTREDLEVNCVKIQMVMSKTEIGTPEYTVLQNQLQKQYEILKKYNESKFRVPIKDIVMIAATAGVAIFFVAMEHENPTALKFCSFLFKMPFLKI